jgi:hypothetical protein
MPTRSRTGMPKLSGAQQKKLIAAAAARLHKSS